MPAPEDMFTFTVDTSDPLRAVVTVVGELDLAGAIGFRNAVSDLVQSHPTVTVDLADLTFIDSTGIGILIAGHKKANDRGSRFEIRGATGIVARAMEIIGVDQVLNIVPPA